MPSPSWILLAWVGLAATCIAAITGTMFGGGAAQAWSLSPRARSAGHGLGVSVGLGLLLYPPAYGIAFELVGRADVLFGVIVGSGHGLIAFVIAAPRHALGVALRTLLMHVAYGATMAFLYVTP
jgi:hypothetical protein